MGLVRFRLVQYERELDPETRVTTAEDRRTVGAGRGSVRGTVWDSTRARPLGDAEVFLVDGGGSDVAGGEGRFTLEEIVSGTHEVGFRHPWLDSLPVVPAPVEVSVATGETSDVPLAIPSLPAILTAICGTGSGDEGSPRCWAWCGTGPALRSPECRSSASGRTTVSPVGGSSGPTSRLGAPGRTHGADTRPALRRGVPPVRIGERPGANAAHGDSPRRRCRAGPDLYLVGAPRTASSRSTWSSVSTRRPASPSENGMGGLSLMTLSSGPSVDSRMPRSFMRPTT